MWLVNRRLVEESHTDTKDTIYSGPERTGLNHHIAGS
jgi:hypothetical protein